MKKSFVAFAFAGLLGSFAAAAATSAELVINNPSVGGTATEFNPFGAPATSIPFQFGSLYATGAGTVTYSYLGSEAGNTNKFFESGLQGAEFFSNKQVGIASFSDTVTQPGFLSFLFKTTSPSTDIITLNNTSPTSQDASFGIVENFSQKGNTYRFALLYNDCGGNGCSNGGDRDFDDMVIGVNFRSAVSPVPEPETLAMFLAGLGLIGGMAKRRLSSR